MANPTWFIEQDYLASKLAKLKAADPETYGSWTTDEVKKAIEEAGLTPYDHFVAFNKEEGTSPNQYFNAYEYIEAKVRQLNADKVDDREDWSFEQVKEALDSVGGAWAHYQAFGAAEGLNPSNNFSVKGYYAAKAAELGGDWTPEKVEEYFKENNVNPLDHYFSLGAEEGITPVDVPAEDRVDPDPTSPVGETHTLTTGRDYAGAEAPETPEDFDNVITLAEHDTIEGVVSSLSSARTLNAEDVIEGVANNTLKLDMQGNFTGFGATGSLKNVATVELTNEGTIARSFAAKGVEGVKAYVLNGAVNLSDLAAADVTVGINDRASGETTIGFTTKAVEGTADALALALANVGTAQVKNDAGTVTTPEAALKVTAAGIEEVAITATGANIVALNAADAKAVTAAGEGSLKLTTVGANVKTVDAAELGGKFDVNLADASDVTSVLAGAGDDIIRAAAGDLAINAEINGGEGADTLALTGALGTVQYQMSGIETLELNGVTALYSASNTEGLENLVLKGASNDVTLANMGAGDLNVTVNKDATGDLTSDHAGSTVMTVSGGTKAAPAATIAANSTFTKSSSVDLTVNQYNTLTGAVSASAAQSFTANIAGVLNNMITLGAATSAVFTDTNKDADKVALVGSKLVDLQVTSAGTFDLSTGSDLSGLESLTVSSAGAFKAGDLAKVNTVELSGAGATAGAELGDLGSTALDYGITVNAQGLAAGLKVGNIDTAAGQSVNLNVAQVLGNVEVGTVTVATGGTPAANTGSITVNANGTAGTVELGALTAKTVTVDASGALNTVGATAGITINAETATFTGSALMANKVDVTATKAAIVTTGIGTDIIDITGAAGGKVAVTITTGLGKDTVKLTSNATADAAQNLFVTITDFAAGEDVLDGWTSATIIDNSNAAAATAALTAFNAFSEITATVTAANSKFVTFDIDGDAGTNTANGILYNGDVYAFSAAADAANSILVKLTGATVASTEDWVVV